MGFKDIVEFGTAVMARTSQDESLKTLLSTRGDASIMLSNEDRKVMVEARRKAKQHTQTGSIIGLCLGVGYAVLIIRRRGLAFRNLRSVQGSGATVRFADGREELITNIAPAARPSFAKNAITYGALSIGGYMLGGTVGGMYAGNASQRVLENHPDSAKRIRAWERRIVITAAKAFLKNAEELDAQRSQRDNIDNQETGFGSWPPPDEPPPEFPRSF